MHFLQWDRFEFFRHDMFEVQGVRLDRALRRRHGRSCGLRLRELRSQESERLCLRHRHRQAGHAEVRHRRHSSIFSERRPLLAAIFVSEASRAVSFADAKNRFSNRVADYLRYRPHYPEGVLDFLRSQSHLSAGDTVADIGSGTGFFAELVLKNGNQVFGVEPNQEMREAGEEYLAAYPRFTSVNGSAEATTLPASSVDFVAAGQAFHWFQPQPTRREFARIVRPGGWVAILWNDRTQSTTGFAVSSEDLLV